jgi:hypothetical protein
MRSFKTDDGYTLEVYSSMYCDWGLCITHANGFQFSNPSCLSNESYGFKPAPRFEDYDEAEAASLAGDDDAFVEWTDGEWVECLKDEADVLLECYGPEEIR